MGAQFQFETIAKPDRAEAEADFERLQDQDRYENGHSYSGGFGMATGIEFQDGQRFVSEDDAYEWLCDHTEKWGPAIAVQAIGTDGNQFGWFVGATCSS